MVKSVREILKRAFNCKPYNKTALQAEADLVAGPCLLHTVVINKTGSAVTVILRDGTAGDIICSIDGAVVGTYIYDADVVNKLTLEITGTTAPDVTINVGV